MSMQIGQLTLPATALQRKEMAPIRRFCSAESATQLSDLRRDVIAARQRTANNHFWRIRVVNSNYRIFCGIRRAGRGTLQALRAVFPLESGAVTLRAETDDTMTHTPSTSSRAFCLSRKVASGYGIDSMTRACSKSYRDTEYIGDYVGTVNSS
jgi:hypothetical protein